LLLPRISIDKLREGQLATPRLAKEAIKVADRLTSGTGVKAVIRRFLEAQREGSEDPSVPKDVPDVIMIGETHCSNTAFQVEAVALDYLLGEGYKPTVLFELSDMDDRDLFGDKLTDMMARLRMGESPAGADLGTLDERKFLSLMALAKLNGCEIGAFDRKKHTAISGNQRELVMTRALKDRIASAKQPLIVVAGSYHFPVLYEELKKSGRCRLVGINMTSKLECGMPDARRRLETSLQMDGKVMHFRAGKRADRQPFDAARLASEVDIDITMRSAPKNSEAPPVLTLELSSSGDSLMPDLSPWFNEPTASADPDGIQAVV
jgi:hypothetical protein